MRQFCLSVLVALGLALAGTAVAAEDSILARVGSETITQQELDAAVESLPQQVRGRVQDNAEQKRVLLDELVKQRLVYSAARSEGYESNAEVLERLETIKKDLMVAAYVEEYLASEVNLSDEDLKAFYRENESQFVRPEMVDASHVLIKDDEQLARKVLEEARSGADFGELARKYSEGPSASRGGALGEFSRGQMVAEFEEAAFGADIGVYPELVQTKFGYHIIRVNSRQEASVMEFADVRDRIRPMVEGRAKGEALDELVKKLELKYEVERFEDRIQ